MPWAAAAAVGAGVVGGLVSGDEPSTGGTQTTQVDLPPWLDKSSQGALSLAEDISAEDIYDPVAAARGLGANDLMRSGFLSSQGFRGAYAPALGQVGGYLQAADMRFPQADIGAYMNPYIESALAPAAREIGEAFERQRNQRNMNAAARGAFGGMRSVLGNDVAEESYLQSIGDLYQRGMASAYDRATGLWQGDRANQMRLAGEYSNLARLGAGLRGQEIQAKLGAGGTMRGIGQALYAEKRDYAEEEQLQPWLAALSSVPYGQSNTTTSTSSRSGGTSPWLTGIGTALGTAGTLGQLGAFSSSRDYKTDAQPVDGSVLDKLAKMPVESWRYKGQDERHVGPYAEDMAKQFGAGDGKQIPIVDAIGVSYAGLKEAGRRLSALEGKMENAHA